MVNVIALGIVREAVRLADEGFAGDVLAEASRGTTKDVKDAVLRMIWDQKPTIKMMRQGQLVSVLRKILEQTQ